MIETEDPRTVAAIRLLYDSRGWTSKPVVVWVGSGASCWAGYPTWEDLARSVHKHFRRYCLSYDGAAGLAAINGGQLPRFFQGCRDADDKMYRGILCRILAPKPVTPVYSRFVAALAALHPIQVLTTNVDELLERHAPEGTTVVQRRDAERAFQLAGTAQPFIYKIHGSISDVDSMVFTTDDYAQISSDIHQLHFLREILVRSSVLFVGYGLRDDHVIRVLAEANDIAAMFGDGPHFAIVSRSEVVVPSSVRTIRYKPDPNRDHRDPIRILEEVGRTTKPDGQRAHGGVASARVPMMESAHFLFDLYPQGRYSTSQTLNLEGEDGTKRQGVVGPGFTNEEIRGSEPDAMHDLVVGLLCFDHVYAAAEVIGRFHGVLGASRFWRLVAEDALRVLHWRSDAMVIFPASDALAGGDLGSWARVNPDRSFKSVEELVSRQILPAPGREREAAVQIADLVSRVHEIAREEQGDIAQQVRALLLLRPSVRSLLGISGGAPMDSLTRWNVHSVLRLAEVVKVGVACRALGIASARIAFGAARLAGPVFAAAFGAEACDDVAGYVVAGRYGASLGDTFAKEPALLDALLAFRHTSAAESLRRNIMSLLASRSAADVAVAINGGLSQAVPPKVLQAARDEFVVSLYLLGAVKEPSPSSGMTLATRMKSSRGGADGQGGY